MLAKIWSIVSGFVSAAIVVLVPCTLAFDG
jgi:hypothetical protein